MNVKTSTRSSADKLLAAPLLQRMLDAVPAVVTLYDINTGQYIFVNKTFTTLLGYEPEELVNGGFAFAVSLVHPNDVDALLAKNQKALGQANANPTPYHEPTVSFEYRMRHKNGEWRWVRTDGTVFSRSADGKVELILNASLNITDRKKAELQLNESLKILEGVLAPP